MYRTTKAMPRASVAHEYVAFSLLAAGAGARSLRLN